MLLTYESNVVLAAPSDQGDIPQQFDLAGFFRAKRSAGNCLGRELSRAEESVRRGTVCEAAAPNQGEHRNG